jgi:ribosome biogenesis protein Nip4
MEKEKNILIRVSEEEKNKVQSMAKKEGLSLSEYARKMMLHGQVIKVDSEDKKVLNGVANNLNQLTRFFNQTGERKPELETTLKEMIDQIRHAYRKR